MMTDPGIIRMEAMEELRRFSKEPGKIGRLARISLARIADEVIFTPQIVGTVKALKEMQKEEDRDDT